MWRIFEKKAVQKSLKKALREVLVRYEAWKRIVELEGPTGLRLIKGFRDKSMKGDRHGYRSSHLGLQWRIVYRVHREFLEVYVIEIHAHNY